MGSMVCCYHGALALPALSFKASIKHQGSLKAKKHRWLMALPFLAWALADFGWSLLVLACFCLFL